MDSVAAIASNDVWAVDGSGLMQTQHWDGTAWSIIATPNPPLGSGLNGVAAVSSGNLWAVGYNDDSNGHFHPLIEHFSWPEQVRQTQLTLWTALLFTGGLPPGSLHRARSLVRF